MRTEHLQPTALYVSPYLMVRDGPVGRISVALRLRSGQA